MGSHSFVHPMMGISDFSDFKIISKGVVRIYIKKITSDLTYKKTRSILTL